MTPNKSTLIVWTILSLQGNNQVVRYQPQTPVNQTVNVEVGSPGYHSNYGKVVKNIAAGLTYLFISLLCFWAIPFSVIAWFFACGVSDQLSVTMSCTIILQSYRFKPTYQLPLV